MINMSECDHKWTSTHYDGTYMYYECKLCGEGYRDWDRDSA